MKLLPQNLNKRKYRRHHQEVWYQHCWAGAGRGPVGPGGARWGPGVPEAVRVMCVLLRCCREILESGRGLSLAKSS